MGMKEKELKFRVWWIPQVPMEAFRVTVGSPKEAKNVLKILADYDTFQFENNIKPDYSNMGGLEVFEEGEWVEWYDSKCEDINGTEEIA